jgi:hypothetical protein
MRESKLRIWIKIITLLLLAGGLTVGAFSKDIILLTISGFGYIGLVIGDMDDKLDEILKKNKENNNQ